MSITKEQALQLKHGNIVIQVAEFIQLKHYSIVNGFTMPVNVPTDKTDKLLRPAKWRVNGKIKTWKRDDSRFQLPIKHGLYDYAYLTNDNCHLFQLID